MGEVVSLPARSATKAWGLSEFQPSDDVTFELKSNAWEADDDDALNYLRELRAAIRAPIVRASLLTTTITFDVLVADRRSQRELVAALEAGRPLQWRRPNDVPLHSLLRFAAVLTVILSLGSLAFWLADFPPLINPFAAVLGVVASPFLYFMGEASRITAKAK